MMWSTRSDKSQSGSVEVKSRSLQSPSTIFAGRKRAVNHAHAAILRLMCGAFASIGS